MYKALLLDVYGTLVRDDGRWAADAAAAIAGPAGVPQAVVLREWDARLGAMAAAAHGPDFVRLAELNRRSLAATAAHFGVTDDAERLCRQTGRPQLFDDTRRFLAAAGVPVCLVSDADREPLHAVLDHHGVVVDAVVTSEDACAYKPRPEPFELALARLGMAPGDVLHVGDSPASDVAGAEAVGIRAVLVRGKGASLASVLRLLAKDRN